MYHRLKMQGEGEKKMSLFSWLPFGRKEEEAEKTEKTEKRPGRGVLTGCSLADTAALARPFARDPFQRLRPPFSPQAAALSLELANTAYTLDLDAWKEAGWNDFSVLIDDSLQSGLDHDGVKSHFKLLRARAALKEYNPFSQLAGALRQREKSDTIKAVCMMRKAEDGIWVLGIGFMGTGSRFYDWISNFRFNPEDGFHRGFMQLCESFEMNAEEIVFPAAAQALGLEKLTLGQVLGEMRSLSSRFRLWMAGHSQGAAVMQVLCHRLIYDWGVLAQNMTGYGFASPTVATARLVYDPAAYPLAHLLNREDTVTRMGALMHLGMCLEYEPDEDFRQKNYDIGMQPEEVEARQRFRFLADGMQDMPSALLHMSALLEVLAEEKGAEGLNELMTSWWAIPAVDKVLWRAGDRALDALDKLLYSAQEAYRALMGRSMDARELSALRMRLRPLVKETPTRRLMEVFSALGVAPHRLAGPYTAMVQEKLEACRPFIWIRASAGLPVRRWGENAHAWPEIAAPAFARRCRAEVPPARGKMRVSYSAARKTKPPQP